jgi:hypothetical protein
MDEVKRLEQAQTQLMINLISEQAKELEQVAMSSHLAAPNMEALLNEVHTSGQVCIGL